MPLVAVLSLHASAAQMGVLGASENAAFIAVGLLAGVIVDRSRRRSVLVYTALGSALVVGTVPVAALTGALSMAQLYLVSFAAGCLMVIEGVAFQAILMPLLGRERLVEGNTTLRASDSVTAMIGPSLAGFLVQLLTAPIAIVVDALSFVFCGVLTLFVRVEEAVPARGSLTRVGDEILEGLRYVLAEPSLRGLAAGGATHNFFSNGAIVALYVLYANQHLGLPPVVLGIVFASGGPGALLGAIVAGRYGRRFGMRDTLVHTQLLTGLARAFVPLAAFLPFPAVALAVGELILGGARSIANVNQLSMRMALTPDQLQGRMNASVRFLMWSVVPFGALAGGFAAERFGLVPTLAVAVVGTTVASLPYLLIPPTERAT